MALRNTSQYALAGVFYGKALAYPCRTLKPEEADLYFIPVLNELDGVAAYRRGNKGLRDAVCPPGSLWLKVKGKKGCVRSKLVDAIEQVRSGASNRSYLSERRRRHLLMTPREGTKTDSRPYLDVDLFDRAFQGALTFAVEEGATGPKAPAKYQWPTATYLPLSIFRGMPLASFVHLRGDAEWEQAPWRRLHRRRPILVSSASNLHHEGGKIGSFAGRAVSDQMNSLRDALYASCAGAGNGSLCTHLHLSADSTLNSHRRSEFALIPTIGALYWSSVFCLQPVGDCCTRKGMIDSMLLGCIPVYFHDCLLQQWPFHWGEWMADAAYYIDMRAVLNKSVDAVALLGAISPDEIARRQRVIAEHAHCLHYYEPSSPDAAADGRARGGVISPHLARSSLRGEEDAFDVTMRAAWRLSQHSPSAPAKASGHGDVLAAPTFRPRRKRAYWCRRVALHSTPPSPPPQTKRGITRATVSLVGLDW